MTLPDAGAMFLIILVIGNAIEFLFFHKWIGKRCMEDVEKFIRSRKRE